VPLFISEQVAIPDEELEWKFIRSSGPGGQNVNKVASAVQLRFWLPRNTSLSAPVKHRLRRLAGQKLVDDGTILFSARNERSQEQNRRAEGGRRTNAGTADRTGTRRSSASPTSSARR
jgi:ribosome-associated protein